MLKTQFRIPMLEREESVISADYETTHEYYMDDEELSDEKNGVENENLKSSINNDEKIQIESNLNFENEKIQNELTIAPAEDITEDTADGRIAARKRKVLSRNESSQNWAEHKNVAEGLMDIALLSANANQLRFLITYNNKASTYFISLGLIVLSLTLQVAVGIALIFKRRIKRSRIKRTHNRINEFLIGGVFMVTVVNVLLAAFTTTDNTKN